MMACDSHRVSRYSPVRPRMGERSRSATPCEHGLERHAEFHPPSERFTAPNMWCHRCHDTRRRRRAARAPGSRGGGRHPSCPPAGVGAADLPRAGARRAAGHLLGARAPVRLPAVVPLSRPAHRERDVVELPPARAGDRPRARRHLRPRRPRARRQRQAPLRAVPARVPRGRPAHPAPPGPPGDRGERRRDGRLRGAVGHPPAARGGLPRRRPGLREQPEPAPPAAPCGLREDRRARPGCRRARPSSTSPGRTVRCWSPSTSRRRTPCATRATSGSRSSRATCSSAPACSTAQALAASASSTSRRRARSQPVAPVG